MNTICMRQSILLGGLLLLLICSCNYGKNNSVHSHNLGANNPEITQNKKIITIEQNDTVKWKADSGTNKNVALLKQIVVQSEPKTIAEYQQKGKQLSEGVDKMVSECRMEGPGHEALHHWLEPLIEDILQLKKTKSGDEGVVIYQRIKSRLAAYNKSFD